MTEAAKSNEPRLEDKPLMERLVALCKRRGFIFQASEIYGGINGFWDFGPLGTELKNNLRDQWWRDTVLCPPDGPDGKPLDIVGIDSAIIQHPRVWEASGHTKNFTDQMADCRETKLRYRADHIICFPIIGADGSPTGVLISAMDGDTVKEDAAKRFKKVKGKFPAWKDIDTSTGRDYGALFKEGIGAQVIGPDASAPGTLTEPRSFNLLFESFVGVLRNDDSKVYLRGETCQGIFTNFKNVLDTSRVKVPFGIAQIGKAFRNEVTPRNFIFRSREFEQMELEFFVPPEDARKWFDFWVAERVRWWESVGLKSDKLYKHEIPAEERAFYSQGTFDIEYQFPFTAPGFGELEGVAHRGDYDLVQHQTYSKQKLEYFDAENNKRYMPHIIEPAAGLTRGVLALLCEGYQVDESRASPEWLKIDPRLAPVKLGIFPLVNKDGMPEFAEKIHKELRRDYTCQYDAKQSIGKRYARMDECGTPFCITVDGDSLSGNTVTVRNRDTATQDKVDASQLKTYLAEKFGK
ncbi:MAG: glycine--tRNA ligase [Bdellovibrionales bacterium]